MPASDPPLASRCAFLRTTLGSDPGSGLLNVCKHIVRDGSQCVGPFLDDTPTTCGLFEPGPARTVPPIAYRP
ncbi:MAG TPA: hypothetical protein VIH05_02470 [Tepidiformaceae bacterium]